MSNSVPYRRYCAVKNFLDARPELCGFAFVYWNNVLKYLEANVDYELQAQRTGGYYKHRDGTTRIYIKTIGE